MRPNHSLSYQRYSVRFATHLLGSLLALFLCGTFAIAPLHGQRKAVFDLNKALQQFEQQVKKGVAITFTLTSQGSKPQEGYTWLYGRRFMLSMPGMEVAFDGSTLRIINQSERTYTLMTPSEQDLTAMNPLALFYKGHTDINDLKDGTSIAIPNDSTNQGRAINLLEAQHLVTLKKTG
ncbi:MAG: MetQ/NlpA family ABC transporter substrate-binding protein, partial [Porphyromonas asaccharolytica]